MCASVLSAVGSEPKCYVQGTSFQAKLGGTISASDIENDTRLISASPTKKTGGLWECTAEIGIVFAAAGLYMQAVGMYCWVVAL